MLDTNLSPSAESRRLRLIERAQQLDELETRKCEHDFATFFQAAWKVLEKSTRLIWTWHLDLVCGHLQDIALGLAGDTVLNEPPGCSKSYTLAVWNAWIWGPHNRPDRRFLCASHTQPLSTRDNRRVRDLVESGWFRSRWPHVELREDQNQKTRFDTTKGGWRFGISIGQGIGEHPHYKIIDDAHNPETVPSDLERETIKHWYDNTMSTRGAGISMDDESVGAVTIVSGQRVHEDDLPAHALSKGGMIHVVLPMRYEAGRMQPTPTGRRDIRTEPGELLCPARFPEVTVQKLESDLGSQGAAAQLQQRPAPLKGLMFKKHWFPTIHHVNSKDIVQRVRFWDVAGTEGGTGPRTAGVLMWRLRNGMLVIADVVKGRWSDDGVEQVMIAVAKEDGRITKIREEKEPGSSGKAVVSSRSRLPELEGYDYKGVAPASDKVTRARPLRSAAEGGRVACLAYQEREGASILARDGTVLVDVDDRRKWIVEYIDEMSLFPVGKLKDQVDATSGGQQVTAEEQGQHGATW